MDVFCGYVLRRRQNIIHARESRTEDDDVGSGSEDMNNEAGKNTPPIPIRPALKVEETNDYY